MRDMKFQWWTLLLAIFVLVCFSWYLDHQDLQKVRTPAISVVQPISRSADDQARIDILVSTVDSLNTRIAELTDENQKIIATNQNTVPGWYIKKEIACSMVIKPVLNKLSDATNIIYSAQFNDCMVGIQQNGTITYYRIEDVLKM